MFKYSRLPNTSHDPHNDWAGCGDKLGSGGRMSVTKSTLESLLTESECCCAGLWPVSDYWALWLWFTFVITDWWLAPAVWIISSLTPQCPGNCLSVPHSCGLQGFLPDPDEISNSPTSLSLSGSAARAQARGTQPLASEVCYLLIHTLSLSLPGLTLYRLWWFELDLTEFQSWIRPAGRTTGLEC